MPVNQFHFVYMYKSFISALRPQDISRLTEHTFRTLYKDHPELKPYMQSLDIHEKISRLLQQVVDLFDKLPEMVGIVLY